MATTVQKSKGEIRNAYKQHSPAAAALRVWVLFLAAMVTACLVEAISKNSRVTEIAAHVEDPQAVKITPLIKINPSTTMCLVA